MTATAVLPQFGGGDWFSNLAIFPLVPGTKMPAIKDWQHVKPGQYPAIGEYGIALTPADLVWDADPRNYPVGRDVLKDLLEAVKPPVTRCVRTGSGGFHLWYRKPPGMRLRKKQERYPGIDFLSAGMFIVGPGSVVDGRPYIVIQDHEPALLTTHHLAGLEEYADAQLSGTGAESMLMYESFKAECEATPPAISGQHGNDATYALACRGRDLALPRDAVFQLMRDHWNNRCMPPWEDAELHRVVANAFRYAKNAAGASSPESKFLALHHNDNVIKIDTYQGDLVMKGVNVDALDLDKRGEIKLTAANITYLLRHDAAWKGRIRYNEFSSALEFHGRPDWRKDQLNQGLELSRRDLACMQVWFSGVKRLEVSEAVLKAAINAAAIPYHPVKDYLNSLVWDGKPRLERLMIDTTGAEDTPYTRAVGKCVLLGAVARIFEPGCKQDYVLVLEGKQGTGKSQWIATLGGEWYSANELVRGDKDTYQNLRGRWFVELPEINSTFKRVDFNWLKGVISNATDVYRASFGMTSQAVPRESIFIGTINPNAGRDYLKDEENRRYWPVETTKINLKFLAEMRDQYFAEAVALYKAGVKAWMADPELEQAAKTEQLARREFDPWIEMLSGWVAGQAAEGFSTAAVWAALGFSGSTVQSHHRQRLYGVLRELGCEYDRDKAGGGMWKRTPQPAQELDWSHLL